MLATGRIWMVVLCALLMPLASFRAISSGQGASTGTSETAQQAAGSGGPVLVSGVTVQKGNSGETFVDVSMSSRAAYRVLQLKDPQRLVVDLEGAQKSMPWGSYKVDSRLLRRVRVAQFRAENPAIVRVVADLKEDPAVEVLDTPGGLRIELKPRELAQAAGPQALNPSQPQGPAPVQQPSPAPANPAPPQQQQGPAPAGPPHQAAPPQPSGAFAAQPPVQSPQVAPPVQAFPPPSVPAQGLPFYRKLPSNSLEQNKNVLDSLGLKIALGYGYRKGGPDEAAWRTKAAPGVEASRLYIRPGGPGSYRTIELAIAPSTQGGFDLVVYGQQVEQSSAGPNPDFPAILQIVNEEIGRIEAAPPPSDLLGLKYEIYYLSYVTADRALALLKTLGYTTIEYNAQAGEGLYQTIYTPVKLGTGRAPIIVKLIDSSKTSIMEPTSTPGAPMQAAMPPAGMPITQPMVGGVGTVTGVPAIGGTYLHAMTSGEPQERLLIAFDKNDPDSLQSLINVLQSTIDVPSRQIMIEALVIELNADKTINLGVTFDTVQTNVEANNAGLDENGNPISIFTFTKGLPSVATFTASLQALLQKGQAQILSNPSVLVLDDRQARIQIGQQVPVSQQVTSLGQTVSSVSYFPVGIVLNLRPRINEDGSEITMQTEAIVSAINKAATTSIVGTQALVAPVVDNRQVQSIVRVANNTPFIIGGLIETNESKNITGIPFLSDIPLLGNLFRSSTTTRTKQEVIIVITPHVVPLEDKYFSYVIPKDTNQFDRFDYQLFRNAYRIRGRDLFDLGFIYDSDVYKQLVRRVSAASVSDPQLKNEVAFSSVLKGGAPGEEILVRRMLWEIIDKTDYGRFVNPDRIVFPESNVAAVGGAGWQIAFLSPLLKNLKRDQVGLALTFEAQARGTEERPFAPPKAVVSYPTVSAETYAQTLINGNARNPDGTPLNWMILLSRNYRGIRVPPTKLLQEVLVLRRLLELNKDMPPTLKEFHIGRQIVFPSQEELQQGNPFIDREVAKLFYEVFNYYPAFEQEFNRQARLINARLDRVLPQ